MRTPHASPNSPYWLSSGMWQRMRINEIVGNYNIMFFDK